MAADTFNEITSQYYTCGHCGALLSFTESTEHRCPRLSILIAQAVPRPSSEQ